MRRSPHAPLAITIGALLTTIGILALVSNDFPDSAGWLVPLSLAAVGIAGLTQVLRPS